MNKDTAFKTVDEYIASFPLPVQPIMQTVRSTICKAAPAAEECISYKMPTYKLGESLVHFAAYGHHIGFYPTPAAIAAFKEELSAYKYAKGSVQFPLDKPMPLDLISRMTLFRVKQVAEKMRSKQTKRVPAKHFAASLSVPAQRALANAGIKTLKQLSKYSEADVLKLHGFGKASLPPLRAALSEAGLMFASAAFLS